MSCDVTEHFIVTVTLYACVQKVLGSSLGPVTCCYDQRIVSVQASIWIVISNSSLLAPPI